MVIGLGFALVFVAYVRHLDDGEFYSTSFMADSPGEDLSLDFDQQRFVTSVKANRELKPKAKDNYSANNSIKLRAPHALTISDFHRDKIPGNWEILRVFNLNLNNRKADPVVSGQELENPYMEIDESHLMDETIVLVNDDLMEEKKEYSLSIFNVAPMVRDNVKLAAYTMSLFIKLDAEFVGEEGEWYQIVEFRKIEEMADQGAPEVANKEEADSSSGFTIDGTFYLQAVMKENRTSEVSGQVEINNGVISLDLSSSEDGSFEVPEYDREMQISPQGVFPDASGPLATETGLGGLVTKRQQSGHVEIKIILNHPEHLSGTVLTFVSDERREQLIAEQERVEQEMAEMGIDEAENSGEDAVDRSKLPNGHNGNPAPNAMENNQAQDDEEMFDAEEEFSDEEDLAMREEEEEYFCEEDEECEEEIQDGEHLDLDQVVYNENSFENSARSGFQF